MTHRDEEMILVLERWLKVGPGKYEFSRSFDGRLWFGHQVVDESQVPVEYVPNPETIPNDYKPFRWEYDSEHGRDP